MLKNNLVRGALFLIGLFGIFVSIWLTLIAAIVLVIRYSAWEVFILGLLIDFLWLPSSSPLVHMPFATLAALIIVWTFESIRKEFFIR